MTEKHPPRLDRTMDMSAEEATLAMHQQAAQAAADPSFATGKASVDRAAVGGYSEPTLTFEEQTAGYGGPGIVTRGPLKQPSVPLRQRVRMLKRGGRWSAIGAAVLVACWGLFALSASNGDQVSAFVALLVIFVVGAFFFGLCRLVGLVVLERTMNRVRRSAWVSHAIIGLFWAACGVSYLSRITWIIDAWNWIRGV
ncbi:MAG: hypothetical protein HOU01_09415 [Streptomycetaceae bacterium]|nr:hypothetical protein [Streptomycetaceae bacterium]